MYVVRMGDKDSYHGFDDLPAMARFMAGRRVSLPLERDCKYGVRCAGYLGRNYISLFVGSGLDRPGRELKGSEMTELQRLIAEELREKGPVESV